MYVIKAQYEGLVHMLFDRFFNPEETERGKAKKKGVDVWKEEIQLKLHADEKGVFQPSDSVRMMLIGNRYRPGAAKILGSFIEKMSGRVATIS